MGQKGQRSERSWVKNVMGQKGQNVTGQIGHRLKNVTGRKGHWLKRSQFKKVTDEKGHRSNKFLVKMVVCQRSWVRKVTGQKGNG